MWHVTLGNEFVIASFVSCAGTITFTYDFELLYMNSPQSGVDFLLFSSILERCLPTSQREYIEFSLLSVGILWYKYIRLVTVLYTVQPLFLQHEGVLFLT